MFGPDVTLLGSGIDPDAARWIATVGQSNVSQPRGLLVSDTIRELKAAGVWADLDFLAVYAAGNAASALVDWKARKTGAAINSPAFTADRGYVFDGATNYVNSLFAPSTDCVAASGTSFFLGVYERADLSSGTTRAMGSHNSTTQSALITPRNSTNMQANLNATTAAVFTGLSDSRGLSVAATNGTVGRGYKNGAIGATPTLTTPGTALPTYPLFVGCYNSLGTPTSFRAASIGMAVFGNNTTAGMQSSLYVIMQRYMTKVGANV